MEFRCTFIFFANDAKKIKPFDVYNGYVYIASRIVNTSILCKNKVVANFVSCVLRSILYYYLNFF